MSYALRHLIIYAKLGWLGREDKILVEQKGRAMVFSLRDEEVRLVVPEETAIEPALKRKSNRRKSKQQKKTKEDFEQRWISNLYG